MTFVITFQRVAELYYIMQNYNEFQFKNQYEKILSNVSGSFIRSLLHIYRNQLVKLSSLQVCTLLKTSFATVLFK